MGVSEILTASDSLGFDFVSKKLLPLIDTMDNDFICYDMFNKEFLLFGLVEELDIVTKKDISDLIDDIS